jgi:NADH:ubiquinone oxidoreductase subunit 2 (subunit N)
MDIKYISQLKAQFIYNPILSLSLAICLFSMAGVPPLLGFFAKQQVLYSATHSGYFFLSIVAILVSVISASYYLQIIKVIHFPSYKYFGQINQRSEDDELPTQTENSNDDLNILYGLKKTSSTMVPSPLNALSPLNIKKKGPVFSDLR